MDSLNYCKDKKGLIIFAYVIMPNHLHLIIRTDSDDGLSSLLRDFKGFTSRKLIKTINGEGVVEVEILDLGLNLGYVHLG